MSTLTEPDVVFDLRNRTFADNQPYVDDGTFREAFHAPDVASRWQKHGHDRVYLDAGGYIDLIEGTVEDGADVTRVEMVESDNKMWSVYYAETENTRPGQDEPVVAIERDL